MGAPWEVLGGPVRSRGRTWEALEGPWDTSFGRMSNMKTIEKPSCFIVFPRTSTPLSISWAHLEDTQDTFGDGSVFFERSCALRGPVG